MWESLAEDTPGLLSQKEISKVHLKSLFSNAVISQIASAQVNDAVCPVVLFISDERMTASFYHGRPMNREVA
jgi:hypothetical protein